MESYRADRAEATAVQGPPTPAAAALFDEAEILCAWELLINSPTEIRIIDGKIRGGYRTFTYSGYFDDVDKLIAELRRFTSWAAVWFLPNQIDPALLSRRADRLDVAGKGDATSDTNIIRRRAILLDTDPIRPAGISSTDAEHAAALQRMREVIDFLSQNGFPDPVLSDSGNGTHAVYLTDLPTADGGLVAAFLDVLDKKFSDDKVKLDAANFNPARAWKLPGTMARKGDNTTDRPHRMAQIIYAPLTRTAVTADQIRDMTAAIRTELPEQNPAKPEAKNDQARRSYGSNGTFDAATWLRDHEPAALGPEPWSTAAGTGERWNIDVCAFNSDHTGGSAFIGRMPSGAMVYECRHNSCRGYHWQEYRELREPGYQQRQRNNGTKKANTKPAPIPTPIPLDAPRAPGLPAGVFTLWLGDFIDACMEAVEVPPELPATFALAAIATVTQRKLSVLISPGYFEPLNIWPVCAMTSGNRKTECMKKAISPLVEREQQTAAEMLPVIEKLRSEQKTIETRISRMRADAAKAKVGADFERVKAEIAELEGSLTEIPSVPQLFTQDVTPEHTGTMLAENGERLSIISDEGGLFDVMGGRYANGVPNLDVYLQAHAGSFVRVNRGSRPPVNLIYPALTIAISPQPDVLAGLTAHKGFRGRGLLARFFYMVPASKLGYRTGSTRAIPDLIARTYRESIFALAAVQPDEDGDKDVPHVLRLNDEARSQWFNFWQEVEAMMRPDGRLDHLTDWGGKLPGLVARIAGLLHCVAYASDVTSNKIIDADEMDRAIRFGRYLIEHALVAFNIMGADPAMEAAKDLWKAIEKLRQPQFSVRDAWNPIRGSYKTVAEVEPGFDVLIDHAYIMEPHQGEEDAPRRRGRPPSRLFIVNPALTEGWS